MKLFSVSQRVKALKPKYYWSRQVTWFDIELQIQSGKANVDQIICNDVHRSFVHFLGGSNFEKEALDAKKLELKTILHCVVTSNKDLSYYQGLNFITELFYLEYGMLRTFLIVEALVRFVFSPYMQGNESFDKTLQKKSTYAYTISAGEIKDFSDIITFDHHITHKDNAMHRLSFVTSWMITFFAYKLNDHLKIMRIFDFLVCSLNPYGICYLVAAFLKALFRANNITINSEAGFVMNILYNGKFNDLDLDEVLTDAFDLMSHPAYQLQELDKKIEKNKKASFINNAFGGFFKFLKKNT